MSLDNRLRATMGLMARDNDNEAVVALRQATRMLASRGLDWMKLADIAIGGAAPRAEARRDPEPKPEPKPKPKPAASRMAIIGAAIPERVAGSIVVIECERTRSGGTMTTFAVVDGDTVYGPIVAYTLQRADTLRNAARNGACLGIDMLTPGEGRHIVRQEFSHAGMRWRNVTFMPQAGKIVWLS